MRGHHAGPPAQLYKNDKADSEKLADLCRLDMIPESFVADKPARDLRELTRTRLGIKMYATGPKNRIHAILAKYPHEQPKGGLFTGPGLEWLQAVPLREVDRMRCNRTWPPSTPC